jgi:hypothetical protein
LVGQVGPGALSINTCGRHFFQCTLVKKQVVRIVVGDVLIRYFHIYAHRIGVRIMNFIVFRIRMLKPKKKSRRKIIQKKEKPR